MTLRCANGGAFFFAFSPHFGLYSALLVQGIFPALGLGEVRRMKTKNVVLAIGIGLLIWYLVTQTKRFDIGTATISAMSFTGSGIRINVKLPIINRSDIPVPINGFLGRLLYEGAEIGGLSLVQPITIAARSVSVPEFSTTISYLGLALGTPLLRLVNTLLKMLTGVSIPGIPDSEVVNVNTVPALLRAMRVQGTIYVNNVGIDINQPLSV